MTAIRARIDARQTYLHALDRALWVGIAVSFFFHVTLVELLPSPFHHAHRLPRTMEVNFAEPPSPPAPPPQALQMAPSAPAPTPSVSAATPQTPSTKPPAKLRQDRQRTAAAAAPTAPSPPTPIARPAAKVPSGPAVPITAPAASPANAETQQETRAAPHAGNENVEGPATPPSFHAGYLRNPAPAYPTASRRLGEEGTVQLRVLVSAEGRPAQVDVHRSSSYPRLDEAAVAAVRAWRFVPAKRGEAAIEAHVIVPIVFRLEQEE